MTGAGRATLAGLAALCAPLCCLAVDTVRMEAIVQYHVEAGTFMGTALVARDGDVVFEESTGFANLEWRIPHAPSTRFQIGSITKQFTAAAILLLAERGELALDDRVTEHVPNAPRAWRRITIFDLLTHTSGIRDLLAFAEYPRFKRSPATLADVLAFFRDAPLEFSPGARMSYSNSGYVLLGSVIEVVSAQSYERFLSDNIFAPLGMTDTGYGGHGRVVASLASGYARSDTGLVNAEFIDPTVLHAAGALYSTTQDLLEWTGALFGRRLLSDDSLARMTTPFLDQYALGVEVRAAHGRRVIEHGGGIEGFNTHLAHYPDDQLTIIVLGNVNGLAPEQIAWQLAAVAFDEIIVLPAERVAIDLAPAALGRFVGTYRSSPTANLFVELDAGRLSIRLGEREPILLYPESARAFFARTIDVQIEFEQDEQGSVTGLVLRQVNRERRAPRIGGP